MNIFRVTISFGSNMLHCEEHLLLCICRWSCRNWLRILIFFMLLSDTPEPISFDRCLCSTLRLCLAIPLFRETILPHWIGTFVGDVLQGWGSYLDFLLELWQVGLGLCDTLLVWHVKAFCHSYSYFKNFILNQLLPLPFIHHFIQHNINGRRRERGSVSRWRWSKGGDNVTLL